MTDEIIINGVNVAECGYFYETEQECNICGMGISGADTFCRGCKDNSNCYYKQLKRLEFRLKVTEADYKASEQENAELKAENERLKSENETLDYQWHKRSEIGDEWYKLAEKYKVALQEIKAIVCSNCEIIDTQGRKDILKLITKAEEE